MRFARVAFGFLLWGAAAPAQVQQYVISTYAGSPAPPGGDPSINVGSIATDASGNVYFAAYINNSCACVFKLDPNGVLTRVAGSAQQGFSGDGGPATSAQLGSPTGLAVDGEGNLFLADDAVFHSGSFPSGYSNDRIRKVSPDGIITTVAGGGALSGSSADGGPATSAQLYYPIGVAVDGAGNLFFSESVDSDGGGSNRVRKVSPDGIITTVAGNGVFGFSGDGGPATSAQLNGPGSLAVDTAGNLFLVDGQRIRKVSPDGTITTVVDMSASISRSCYCSVTGVALDSAGNLFYSVYSISAVFKQSPAGVVSTLVATEAGLGIWWLAVDNAGNLFLPGGSSLRKVSPDGFVTTLFGDGACCYSGDGGRATSAQLLHPNSVAADGAGNLFIADTDNHRVRKVTPAGIITTMAGNGAWSIDCNSLSGSNAPATAAQLCSPSQVAADGAGNLFIVDRNRIRKASPDGTIASVAGDGTIGTSGDGGLATEAQLADPNSLAVDGAGNLYFAEWARVRKITPDGIIATVAGDGARVMTSGSPPPVVDGQPATSVQLFGPTSAAVDRAGNLYFVDRVWVRKVSADGIITTVAGNGGSTGYHGYTGDGGPATNAPLWNPNGVTVDSEGNLYISEPVRIRKVTADGIINTIAGSSEPGYSGDGGPATKAQLWNPTGITVDAAGNVYVADSFNNVVRILRPAR